VKMDSSEIWPLKISFRFNNRESSTAYFFEAAFFLQVR
jgi:hypothetical protein